MAGLGLHQKLESSLFPHGKDSSLLSSSNHKKLVTIGFYVALIFLALINLSSYLGMRQLIRYSELALHSNELRAQLHQLLSVLVNAETMERGYVITGDERFLEPHKSEVGRIDDIINKLWGLSEGNPTYHTKLETLRTLTSSKLKLLQEQISYVEKGWPETAIQSIKTREKLDLMEAIRCINNSIKNEETIAITNNISRLEISSHIAIIMLSVRRCAEFTGSHMGIPSSPIGHQATDSTRRSNNEA
jgi:CHASE3 domain sensor protein